MKNRQKRLLNNRIAALMLSAALVAPVLTAFLWRKRPKRHCGGIGAR